MERHVATEGELAEQSEEHERLAAARQLRAEQRAATERRLEHDAREAGLDDLAFEHEQAAKLHDEAAAFQATHRQHSAADAARHAAAAQGVKPPISGEDVPPRAG